MLSELKLPRMIKRLEQACESFPDLRTGKNSVYELVDVGMSAFAVFFTQSPSFLAHQRDLQLRKGRCNAENLFDLSELPSDNQNGTCWIRSARSISNRSIGTSFWHWKGRTF